MPSLPGQRQARPSAWLRRRLLVALCPVAFFLGGCRQEATKATPPPTVEVAAVNQAQATLAQVYGTLQTFMGGLYVNLFNRFGR